MQTYDPLTILAIDQHLNTAREYRSMKEFNIGANYGRQMILLHERRSLALLELYIMVVMEPFSGQHRIRKTLELIV